MKARLDFVWCDALDQSRPECVPLLRVGISQRSFQDNKSEASVQWRRS